MTPTHPAADGYRHNAQLAINYHRFLIEGDRVGHTEYSHHIIESHQEFQLATGYQALLQLALSELSRSTGGQFSEAQVFDRLAEHANQIMASPQLDTEVRFLDITRPLEDDPGEDST